MLVLRVDIDNPYNYYHSLKKYLNYISLNLINLRFNWLGYLEHFYELHDYLYERGVKATFFIRVETVPRKFIKTNFFEIALHAVDTSSFNSFKGELVYLKRSFNIYGFSKHGFGKTKLSRRHDPSYDPEKYIEWGIKLGLKYFSGNSIGIGAFYKIRDFIYFPSIVLLEDKKLSVDEIILKSKDEIVVVCFHPIHWFNRRYVFERLSRIISSDIDIYCFIDLVKRL